MPWWPTDFKSLQSIAYSHLRVDAQGAEDIVALLERLNVAGKSSLVVPNEYLKVVIVKR